MPAGLFETPAPVRSLRKYWKGQITESDIAGFAAEMGGESDRAMIVISAAFIDDLLRDALVRRFAVKLNSTEADYVFRFDGPLGSFSARTEAAYLFGLLSESYARQLSELREMRNGCAHSIRPISFKTPELVAVAARFANHAPHFEGVGCSPTQTRAAVTMHAIIILACVLLFGEKRGGQRAKLAMRDILLRAPSPEKSP